MKRSKLRIPVPSGSLRTVSSVAVQLNGTQIDTAAVRWKASAPRVIVRGTLEGLGLQPGVVASVRLLVDGVPTPAVDFTP